MIKKKGKSNSSSLNSEASNALQNDMRQFGYLLPTSDEELEEFEKIYGTTQVMFPEHLKDASFLFKKEVSTVEKKGAKVKAPKASLKVLKKKDLKSTKKKSTSKKSDYFKKIVLAADIAYKLHQEPTFGHVKFVKLHYLCQEVCHMNFQVNYGRYAAGPLDPKLMYSIDKEFVKQGWFSVAKGQYGYRYEPLDGVEKYKSYFNNYYAHEANKIDQVIELFQSKKSDFCEIVATMFYIWKDFLGATKIINDNSLISDFYDWDEKKKRFGKPELTDALKWMRENSIFPIKANMIALGK